MIHTNQAVATAAFPADAAPRSRSAVASGSRFIINPVADWVLLILSPVLALGIGFAISGTGIAQDRLPIFGHEHTIAGAFIGVFTMAHLFIVFFRSHGNRTIFRLHPVRFTVVPIALFLAICVSLWAAVFVSVLATWWDVYHSSLQTFGIGRIYDMKRGNRADVGRTLDIWLNLLLYAGPILGGATLMGHVIDFEEFQQVGSVFFTSIPAYAESHARYLTSAVLSLGSIFLVYYVIAYWRLYQQGYRISPQKVALLVSTGAVSIWTWGFNPFGTAFFIMNFFHALQYFAIVWSSEKTNMMRCFGLESFPGGKALTLGLLIVIGFTYGVWAELLGNFGGLGVRVVIVVSIMHFWYDGFIWSVSKNQVS